MKKMTKSEFKKFTKIKGHIYKDANGVEYFTNGVLLVPACPCLDDINYSELPEVPESMVPAMRVFINLMATEIKKEIVKLTNLEFKGFRIGIVNNECIGINLKYLPFFNEGTIYYRESEMCPVVFNISAMCPVASKEFMEEFHKQIIEIK